MTSWTSLPTEEAFITLRALGRVALTPTSCDPKHCVGRKGECSQRRDLGGGEIRENKNSDRALL